MVNLKSKFCDICKIEEDNSIECGDIMEKWHIKAHYFCLLLSTNLPQRGEDNCGILGFLQKDIIKEICAAQTRVCCYCQKLNATTKCASCTNYFHVLCGVKNNCLFQFIEAFISFCHKHHGIEHQITHMHNEKCYICLENMGNYNPLTSFMSKCCSYGWIHRSCLKKYALSAGYYLKCLWCGDGSFRNYVRYHGIFVPDRDALWEKQKNAYAGLHEGYKNCDAIICLCPKGRKHINKGKWKIYVCCVCGSSGIHESCIKEAIANETYRCADCNRILIKYNTAEKSKDRTNNFDRTLYVTKSYTLDYANLPFSETISAFNTLQNESVWNVLLENEQKQDADSEVFMLVNSEKNQIEKYVYGKRNCSEQKNLLALDEVEVEKEATPAPLSFDKNKKSIEKDENLLNFIKNFMEQNNIN